MLFASTAPAPAVAAPSTCGRPRARRGADSAPASERVAPRPTPGRLYAGLAALTLALGALSLLAPSTPSYDPWSWTLWAREIVHGHLVITTSGTSWKPLPMIFTIPFALFGPRVAPDLWLVVARAGAIAAVLMAFRLAYRLVAEIAAERLDRDRGLTVRAPALLAGLVALIALGFAARGAYITDNGLGYSDALAAALALVAIDCVLDRRHRAAFLVGFLVALDRPEIWLFWVPYGLWLARRDRSMRALDRRLLHTAAARLVPAGVPGLRTLRLEHHPRDQPPRQQPGLRLGPVLGRVRQGCAADGHAADQADGRPVLVAAVAAAAWRRHRQGTAAGRSAGGRALAAAVAIGLGGLAWFVVIAVMTQIGFSGNNRYLVLGAALVDVCGAVGFGCLAIAIASAWTRARARAGAAGDRSAAPRLPRSAAAAAAFALLPAWIQGSDFVALPKLHRALLYQARLRTDLGRAIALVGGREHLLACGSVMVEGFQVPMVAYALDVPTTRVLAQPALATDPGPEPDTILQTRATQSSGLLPRVQDWNAADYTYRGSAGPWNTFTRHCASGS